jgi:hypothetical protein
MALKELGRRADALGVGAAKLLVSFAVLGGGFRAVSDDDYARVVIAERFVTAPRLDPSGTSWLPLPFWIYGASLRLFGVGLGVARVTAIFLGVLAVLLLLGAARLLGAGRAGAVLGVLVAALFPWSAWLGAATVPEAPTAALIVFALATLATSTLRERLLGAVAIAAACFSRYEAWPAALGFAAFTTYDAARALGANTTYDTVRSDDSVRSGDAARRYGLLLLAAGAVSLSAIALWLLHGTFVHGDTFFFWKRVAGYRHALGGEAPLAERLLAVPRALVTDEPELALGCVLFAPGLLSARYARPTLVSLMLAVFLAAGELSGGGPTHHGGRAVLPLWYLAALALGDAIGRRVEHARRPKAWLVLAPLLVALGWLFRIAVPPGFPDRNEAVQIGAEARRLHAPALLIDTPDYSYLAVIAAFGAPRAAEPFDDHDPRHPRPPNPFASEATLRAFAATHPDAWLVVSRAHASLAARLGRIVTETPEFVLVAEDPRPDSAGAPARRTRAR